MDYNHAEGSVNNIRLLNKNAQPIYYATYVSKAEVLDEWGNSTGGWTLLITDRTAEDVARVNAKKWGSMTAAEQSEWLAGLKGANNAISVMTSAIARMANYNYVICPFSRQLGTGSYALSDVFV